MAKRSLQQVTINRNREMKDPRMVGAIKVSQGVDATITRKNRRTAIGIGEVAMIGLVGTTTDQRM